MRFISDGSRLIQRSLKLRARVIILSDLSQENAALTCNFICALDVVEGGIEFFGLIERGGGLGCISFSAVEDSCSKICGSVLAVERGGFEIILDRLIRFIVLFEGAAKIDIHFRIIGQPTRNLRISLDCIRKVSGHHRINRLQMEAVSKRQERTVRHQRRDPQQLVFGFVAVIQLGQRFGQAGVGQCEFVVDGDCLSQRFRRAVIGAIPEGVCPSVVPIHRGGGRLVK